MTIIGILLCIYALICYIIVAFFLSKEIDLSNWPDIAGEAIILFLLAPVLIGIIIITIIIAFIVDKYRGT